MSSSELMLEVLHCISQTQIILLIYCLFCLMSFILVNHYHPMSDFNFFFKVVFYSHNSRVKIAGSYIAIQNNYNISWPLVYQIPLYVCNLVVLHLLIVHSDNVRCWELLSVSVRTSLTRDWLAWCTALCTGSEPAGRGFPFLGRDLCNQVNHVGNF